MNGSRQPARIHKTTLRNLDALQVDLSIVNTQECPAITLQDLPPPGLTTTHMFPPIKEHVQEIGHPVMHSFTYTQVTSGDVLVPVEKASNAKTIIPFTPSVKNFQRPRQQEVQQMNTSLLHLPLAQRRTSRKWISITIRTGITVLLFVFLFKSVSWTALATALLHSRHPLLLTGLIIGAFGLVVSSYQWHTLMRGEHSRLDLTKLINLYMVGIAFSHFLPTGMGGDAVKALYAGREAGNMQGAASAVLMSRLTGLIGMLVIAIAVLVIWHQLFPATIIEWFVLLSLLVTCAIIAAVFFVSLLPRFSRKRWTQNRLFVTLMKVGNALQATIRKPRVLSIATIFGMLFWVVGCLNYYTYAIALGIHLPLYFYFVAISLISLISFLPISINGFGVREGAFVYIFATVHVATSISVLLALLMDTQVLFFGVLGGLVYLTMNRKSRVEQQEQVA